MSREAKEPVKKSIKPMLARRAEGHAHKALSAVKA